jgi:hypothetical protein
MVNKKSTSKKSASTSTTPKTPAPVVDKKMAAANDDQPKAGATPAPTPAPTKAPKQEFLVKLRSKGDLLKALKADGILFLENKLYRLDNGKGGVHRVSKRRALAFIKAELVLPTSVDKSRGHHPNAWALNLAKLEAPKEEPKPEPAAAKKTPEKVTPPPAGKSTARRAA